MKNIVDLWQLYVCSIWHWWAIVGIVITLCVACKIFSNHRETILTVGGLMMVITGGFLQIHILNQNMQLINGTSILSEIAQSGSATSVMSGTEISFESGYVTARATNQQAGTIKEKVAILERDIDHAEKEIISSREFILGRFAENKLATEAKLNNLSDIISRTNKLLGNSVVGDYRFPLFSVLIAVLGSVILVLPTINKIKHNRVAS